MACVGPIMGRELGIGGNVQVILTDAEGNIKKMQTVHNVINAPIIFSAFWSTWFNGGQDAGATTARYLKLVSGVGAGATSLSTSMSIPFSGTGTAVVSAAMGAESAQPGTGAINYGGGVAAGIASWTVSGTFSFSESTGNFSSIVGVVLEYNHNAGALVESWFAQATFAQLAIANTDKLTIIWYFCMCTSNAGA